MDRSEIMSRIRAKETRPEKALRRALWKAGARGYRKNDRAVEGKPDLCWRGRKVAVFVDSCFWHRCPVHYKAPKTNREYWEAKTERNRQRDREVTALLKSEGWMVLRLWTHLSLEKMVRAVLLALTRRGFKPLEMP